MTSVCDMDRGEDPKYEQKKSATLVLEDIVSNAASGHTFVWTVIPAEGTVPETGQCGQDYDPFRLQGQPEPPEDQKPYPVYPMCPQAQQFTLSSVTGVEGTRQSDANSWFITKQRMCSMIPGEVQTSDLQAFEERSLDSNHLTHPYNENQSGQVLPMNSEPAPVFVKLENSPVLVNDSVCEEKVVATLPLDCSADPELEMLHARQNARKDSLAWGNYNQVDQQHSRKPTANSRHPSVSQSAGTSRAPRSRKPCRCTKSKCLKLYCECFASGLLCNNCNCNNCHNNPDHKAKRIKAIKRCLIRNPDAFKAKISEGKWVEVKGWHNKGCNCKRSGCLKNYCECYEANIRCTPNCKCLGCRNYYANLMDSDKGSSSVITPAVLESVVGCLLVRAEEAQHMQQSEACAQQMVLNEFGYCLSLIVKTMFKQ